MLKRALLTFCLGLFLSNVAVAGESTTAGQQSQDLSADNLLFILDASGSMWGRVDGTPKIVIAKQVMSTLAVNLPDGTKAGLMAYGHRRKGDCSDIESLVALGPLDRGAMIAHIQALNAKGKTPITASVKQAIEQLRQTEESASIVLVSDGLESCGGDPCKAVKAAKQSGVDFRLHVVGFDLGDADTSQLQCMADAGGGQLFTAANTEDLTAALAQAVAIKPGLVLEVTSNDKRIPARVFIYSAGSEQEVERGTLDDAPQSHDKNPLRVALNPGVYDVKVVPSSIEGVERTLTNITVPEASEITRTVDFSDGTVELTVTTNGKPLKARTYIQHADSHKEAARDGTNGDGIASYTIPVGEYRIQVRPDGIKAGDRYVEGVTVNPAAITEVSLDFPSDTKK